MTQYAVLIDAGGSPTPRAMATSLRADSVTHGPFIDSRQIVAGLHAVEAAGLDGAPAIARTGPVTREGGGVEVRPVHSGGVVEDPIC